MKQTLSLCFALCVLLFAGCTQYDDSALSNRIDNLESRVEALEELCEMMNTNISSLQSLVAAMQQNDYITSVTPITDDGKTIGYRIEFAKGEPIIIYHGEDGKDGANGADGKDASDLVPEIGIRVDDDGIYYWTLDGEWLLDDNGNKIPAQGRDGEDGENGESGKNGENGITPLLKIEDDYWYISYDEGASWTLLGKATGEDGEDGKDATNNNNSIFKAVTQDELYVYIELTDGTIFTLPKKAPLAITFEDGDLVVMSTNSSRKIHYSVTSATEDVKVAVTSSADIKAKVESDSTSPLTGSILVTTSDTIDEYSQVIVFVSNGERVIMQTISFEQSGLQISENSSRTIAADGGYVELAFLTNVECEVVIPDNVSWLSLSPETRALEPHIVTLEAAANKGMARSCEVVVRAVEDKKLAVKYTLKQESVRIANNQIMYATNDGNLLSIQSITDFVSHTYVDGIGIITFNSELRAIDDWVFAENSNLTSMVLPDAIKSIGYAAFAFCPALTSVELPEALEEIDDYVFYQCTGMKELHIPRSVTTFGESPFFQCCGEVILSCDLEDVILTSEGKINVADLPFYNSSLTAITFDDQVRYIGDYTCFYTESIERLEIGENVTAIGQQAFYNCTNLKEIYCYAITPPALEYYVFDDGSVIHVPDESVQAYQNDPRWGAYNILGLNEEIYTSKDYSSDGEVVLLQQATEGKGIDVIIMGDAYSDRQIASGFYEEDMTAAIDHLFSEEPYKSFRHLFNVYLINAVSAHEGYGYGDTAFSGYFGDGTHVGGDDQKVLNYSLQAISEERMDEALIIVIMNRRYYAGTCWMYYPAAGDYGNGVSISYFPYETREQLRSIILHEAGGHGFSKLADEYSYESYGAIPEDVIEQNIYLEQFGWYKNVDYTSNRSLVKWSHFLDDSRYNYDGLGVYEGGCTYWSGVWRPTEYSNMRHNEGGFNAPSREAIYTRIHKLAYGESWQYDYEDFVKYDAINRKSAAAMSMTYRTTEEFTPLHEPIVVNKSWRDIVK